MNTPHDRAVRDLFDRALVMTDAERSCLLASAYHSMPEVAREADELLRFHDERESALDHPLFPALAHPTAQPDRASPIAPPRLGPFAVGRAIGRPEQGQTYARHEAVDTDSGRRMVLTVARISASDGPRVQALRTAIGLDHPALAPVRTLETVHDPGSPQTMLAFCAVEAAAGLPITEFARARSLPIRERLALLLPVLDAAGMLHARALVHGDIRPAAVLIDDHAHARLALFGAAIAPEIVDPRRDVAALGAIVHELIRGQPPACPPGAPSASSHAELTPSSQYPQFDALARRAGDPRGFESTTDLARAIESAIASRTPESRGIRGLLTRIFSRP